MPVTEILIVRHADRHTWIVDHVESKYLAAQQNPTGIETDPSLTAHGLQQSRELAIALHPFSNYHQPNSQIAIFSSPFYRCLQTIAPTVSALRQQGWSDQVKIEAGFGEWFGTAPFMHPAPLDPAVMHENHFDFVHPTYQSQANPSLGSETYEALGHRTASALHYSILQAESDAISRGKGDANIILLIACHTAPIIMSGRALTRSWPTDPGTDDFKCYLAGLTRFQKQTTPSSIHIDSENTENENKDSIVAKAWRMLMNSDCSYLSRGAEGGWTFNAQHVQDEQILEGLDGRKVSTHDYTSH